MEKVEHTLARWSVSIPYLRVTHAAGKDVVMLPNLVSIPYLRVTHQHIAHAKIHFIMFQSPIYGSRTAMRLATTIGMLSFNPLSTGHAPRLFLYALPDSLSFNPLSTGHAR